MHPTAYNSSNGELQNWLALYSDHPGADKIYKLAAKRGGTGNLRKPAPVTGYLKIREQAVYQGEKYKASVTRNDDGKKAVAALNRSVRAKAAKGSPSAALKELNESESAKLLDAVEKDILNSHIAAGYLY